MEKNNRARALAAGATSGFVGQYFSDIISNVARGKADILGRASGYEEYLAGIASGFTGAVFSGRVSLLALTLLSAGVYYGVARTLAPPGEEPFGTRLLSDYLRDSLIVYLLLFFQERLSESIPSRREPRETGDVWSAALLSGLVPSVYFGLRDLFFPPENDRKEQNSARDSRPKIGSVKFYWVNTVLVRL